jgi:hypothetical protein
MRTFIEVKRDIQKIVNCGALWIYWYISFLLLVVASESYTLMLIPAVLAGIISIYFMIVFAWMMLDLKDYNGVNYFINTFTKAYFKGSRFDKFNEKYI